MADSESNFSSTQLTIAVAPKKTKQDLLPHEVT